MKHLFLLIIGKGTVHHDKEDMITGMRSESLASV